VLRWMQAQDDQVDSVFLNGLQHFFQRFGALPFMEGQFPAKLLGALRVLLQHQLVSIEAGSDRVDLQDYLGIEHRHHSLKDIAAESGVAGKEQAATDAAARGAPLAPRARLPLADLGNAVAAAEIEMDVAVASQ